MKLFMHSLLFVLLSSFLSAFSFNGWHSGMMLENVLQTEQSTQKHFKHDTCGSSCRDLYFTEEILGATAKITLHFTFNEKVLYRVEVLWGSGVKEEDLQAFTDELVAYLDRKYGAIQVYSRPDYHGFSVLKEKRWQPDPNTEIVARKGASSLALILTDIELKSNHDFEMSQHLKDKQK